MKAQREAQKPLTREDLKELVVALGGLVRESVKAEMEPLRAQLDRAHAAIGVLQKEIRETHRYVQALDAFNAGIDTKITDMMAREAARLGRERDLEHRSFLGRIDLARHPDRPGATMEQLREAEKTAAAFRAGEQAQRETEAREDGIRKRDDRPVVVDGELVPTVVAVDRETKTITIGQRSTVDGEVVEPKRERGGMLGP